MASAAASPPVSAAAQSDLPGPFPVGGYAERLRDRLRGFAQVQLVGEAFGVRRGRAKLYFELRDARGALPCSMWASDFDALGFELCDGMRVVAGGGCDFYAGSATSSPAFSFAVRELRLAGEGDLLVQLERLRRKLHAEGLSERQRNLPRAALPKAIGVVTGEGGKAREDVLAALERRGWAGTLVWGFAPVQDRHAAPAIAAALRDLAALPMVETVIVARGGGSLADLFAFCDEALCRTVALLRVPVISSVGHHTDRTLIDEVAAVCCSTPTHAAEAAVAVDVTAAAAQLAGHVRQLHLHGRRAVSLRARSLSHLARVPAQHLARQRAVLHQLLRELRASARRGTARQDERVRTAARALQARGDRLKVPDRRRQQSELERLRMALDAHDPQRTLARGYAMVQDRVGQPLSCVADAREAADLTVRFHDGTVDATVDPEAA